MWIEFGEIYLNEINIISIEKHEEDMDGRIEYSILATLVDRTNVASVYPDKDERDEDFINFKKEIADLNK